MQPFLRPKNKREAEGEISFFPILLSCNIFIFLIFKLVTIRIENTLNNGLQMSILCPL